MDDAELFDVCDWPKSAEGRWAEHIRSAQVFQTSTCSAFARAWNMRTRGGSEIVFAFDALSSSGLLCGK
jgi:hypothetical protein